LSICPLDLLIESLNIGWEEASKIKFITLLFGKGTAFVQIGAR